MTQRGVVFLNEKSIKIDIPSSEHEVMEGLKWGLIETFPSPAYWLYQVTVRKIEGKTIKYKLGRTLSEEVAACLLGGHGIPAKVGLAAYEHIKKNGIFDNLAVTEEDLLQLLIQPMDIEGKLTRYRFAKQKAKYLAAAFKKIGEESPPMESGLRLRNWLTQINGIGLKTASWVARNWLDADDVAILDIHIWRAGVIAGFFKKNLTVERHYLELEKQFLNFSNALGVRPSELDAAMWVDMMSSPNTVHRLLAEMTPINGLKLTKRRVTQNRQTNTNQAIALI